MNDRRRRSVSARAGAVSWRPPRARFSPSS